MAKPIKETPVLRGDDAANFLKKMNENSIKKLDPKVIAKMRENFSKLQSIAQFN
jgi:HD-GYP domain-containing protein (c-di-GMP phosphodiesterase class II)